MALKKIKSERKAQISAVQSVAVHIPILDFAQRVLVAYRIAYNPSLANENLSPDMTKSAVTEYACSMDISSLESCCPVHAYQKVCLINAIGTFRFKCTYSTLMGIIIVVIYDSVPYIVEYCLCLVNVIRQTLGQ